jgi:tRNA nucleotidyltransferase (CCA-adding enzyme)
MRRMVASGEANALVPERVWQELACGLMEKEPSRMVRLLRECSALARIAPEIDALFEGDQRHESVLAALDTAAREGGSLEVRFAVLARALDPLAVEALAARLKVSAACRDLALLAARHANVIIDAAELDAGELLELLDAADAWRRPERWSELITAATVAEPETARVRERLERVRKAAAAVDAAAIARAAESPGEIRQRLHSARLAAVNQVLEA